MVKEEKIENLGKKTTLLVEKNNMAHAENFIPVKLDGEFASGQLIDVQLTEFNDKHMLAKVA